MKKKFFAFWAVCAVVLSAVGFSFAADGKKGKNNQLLALLPASEAAMTVDVKRFLSDALPQILSANQPMLTDILSKIEEMKTRTGVDARQFEQIAAGVSSFKSSDYGFDYEPIALARGQFDSAVLIAAAKTVAAGKYREEKIGTRTVYIFSPEKTAEAGKYELREGDGKETSKVVGFLAKFLVGLNKEMALTAYDKNTLAIGSLARVRELLDTVKPRLGGEVANLVARNPNAIASFGALLPNGLSNFMSLDEDELGKSLAGIRQLSGSMDVAGGNTTVAAVAKTVDPAQARNLKDTIAGFQSFAGILKSSKREDQKVYGRMLENAKLTQTGSELAIDLLVPQSDLNVIVGAKK